MDTFERGLHSQTESRSYSWLRIVLACLIDPVGASVGAGSFIRPRPLRVIFVGPSLYGVHVYRRANELWLPPAIAGDILRIVDVYQPRQIVLIDGCFYQSLSVWHKELVYAMLRGVTCIGAASMGALRAAELHRYGMHGVGEIFRRYAEGEEDDSLVAMSYDEATFRPLREAPLQALKAKDALAAIEFARSHKAKSNPILLQETIDLEAMHRTLERIQYG